MNPEKAPGRGEDRGKAGIASAGQRMSAAAIPVGQRTVAVSSALPSLAAVSPRLAAKSRR